MKIYISFFTQVVTHTMLKLAMNACIVSLQLSQLHIHIEETTIDTVCKRIRNLSILGKFQQILQNWRLRIIFYFGFGFKNTLHYSCVKPFKLWNVVASCMLHKKQLDRFHLVWNIITIRHYDIFCRSFMLITISRRGFSPFRIICVIRLIGFLRWLCCSCESWWCLDLSSAVEAVASVAISAFFFGRFMIAPS